MAQWYKKIVCYIIDIVGGVVKTLFQIPRGCCRFYPSCTDFSKEALEKLPIRAALWEIIKRLFKCHPLCRGGFDPVTKYKLLWKDGTKSE
jgi:uncharacterized protein